MHNAQDLIGRARFSRTCQSKRATDFHVSITSKWRHYRALAARTSETKQPRRASLSTGIASGVHAAGPQLPNRSQALLQALKLRATCAAMGARFCNAAGPLLDNSAEAFCPDSDSNQGLPVWWPLGLRGRLKVVCRRRPIAHVLHLLSGGSTEKKQGKCRGKDPHALVHEYWLGECLPWAGLQRWRRLMLTARTGV